MVKATGTFFGRETVFIILIFNQIFRGDLCITVTMEQKAMDIKEEADVRPLS